MAKNPTHHHYRNYYLNQFLKDAINSLTPERLRLLDSYDQERVRKKTIFRAPLEEKLWFLGKLGYRFALFLYPRTAVHDVSEKGLSFANLHKALKIFKKKTAIQNVKILSGMGIFVQTDAHFMNALSLISTVYNSKLYTVVRDYDKIVENAEKVSYSSISDSQAEEVKNAIKLTDNLIISAFDVAGETKGFFESMFKITFKEYKILSFLSRKSNVVLKKDVIEYMQIKTGGATNLFGRLISNKFIIEHIVDDKPAFTISGTGENTLRMARQHIIQNSL